MYSWFRSSVFSLLGRGVLFSFCFVFISYGQADLRETLDEFTGKWEGEYKIYALDGHFNRAYTAHRKYEWRNGVQRVESTYSGAGESKHFQGENSIRLGRIYSSISSHGRPVENFEGEVSKKGILWKNIHNKNRNYKERIVQTPEGVKLETEGFEVFPARGISGLVKVVGVFHRPGVVLSEEKQKDDSLAGESRTVVAERSLEQRISEKMDYLKTQTEKEETARVALLENEIKEASAEIKTLKQYLSESKETVQDFLAEKQLLEKRLEQITTDRDGLKSSLEDSRVAYQKRIDGLEAKEARIKDLEEEQAKWIVANKGLNEQVSSLRDEINSIQKTNTGLIQEKEDLQAKFLLTSNEKETALRREIEQRDIQLKEMKGMQLSLEKSKTENAALGVKVKSLSAELVELRDQVETKAELSDQAVTQMESLKAENQKLSDMLALHKNQEVSFKEDLSQWEASKAVYEGKLKQVSDERENERKDHTEELTAVKLEVKRLEEEAGGFIEEKSGLLKTIGEMKTAVAKFEQEKKNFELSSAKTAAELAAFQSNSASVEEKLREYESKLQVVVRERDLLQKEKDAIESKFFQRDKEREATEKKLVALAAQIDDLSREKAALVGEMKESQKALLAERDRLAQEEKRVEQEILRLKGDLLKVEEAAKVSATQLASLEKQKKSEANSQLKELIEEKSMLQKKVKLMEGQLRSFDQSNADLTRENERLVQRQKEYERISAGNDSLINGLRISQAEVESLKAELAELKGRSSLPVQRPASVSSGSRKGSPKINAQVISGTRSTPLRPQNEINEVISGFKIIGVNRSPRGDKIILNGQVFQVGEIVDYAREITFLRLESDVIIFGGPDKSEYRLKL